MTNFVPNIKNLGTFIIDNNQNVIIQVEIDNNEDTQRDIKIGKRIKMYIYKDNNQIEFKTEIKSVDIINGTIVIAPWDNINIVDTIFIYGTEVNDYLFVDKDKLGIMALQGVKELSQIIEKQEETIKTQQSQLDKLTQWAITQGYN
jgi:hypothetical protein